MHRRPSPAPPTPLPRDSTRALPYRLIPNQETGETQPLVLRTSTERETTTPSSGVAGTVTVDDALRLGHQAIRTPPTSVDTPIVAATCLEAAVASRIVSRSGSRFPIMAASLSPSGLHRAFSSAPLTREVLDVNPAATDQLTLEVEIASDPILTPDLVNALIQLLGGAERPAEPGSSHRDACQPPAVAS